MTNKKNIKKNIFANKRVSGIVFALIVILLFGGLYYYVNGIETRACKSVVKNSLRAPSTAIFYDVHKVGDGLIKGKVESQNGFGAMGINYFYCTDIVGEMVPVFKDGSDESNDIYDHFEEIEESYNIKFDDDKLKKLYRGKDFLESCEQFVKEYLGKEITVYGLELFDSGKFGTSLKGSIADFYVNKDGENIKGRCFKDLKHEYGKNRNWVFSMDLDGKTITEYDL